jgi:hypothetical protein
VLGAIDKLKSAAAGGVGVIDAYFMTIPVLAGYAQGLLPQGLSLISDPYFPEFHPLVLMFGRQRNVRPGFAPFGGISYHEFAQIVPFVDRDDADRPSGAPFSYMPRLLLDDRLAVTIGEKVYGFNKRMARISAQGGNFAISGDFGEIRAKFQRKDLPGKIGDFAEIEDYTQVFKQPLISRRQDGEWIYSFLHYDIPQAVFQLANATIAAPDVILPNAMLARLPELRGLGMRVSFPWYWFSANWRISIPFTSGQLSEKGASAQLSELHSFLDRTQISSLIRR